MSLLQRERSVSGRRVELGAWIREDRTLLPERQRRIAKEYWDKYIDAISRAVEEGREVPEVRQPQDFLAYADEGFVELRSDGSAYSNLGILLVGLAIEHLYHQSAGRSIPYQEILKHYLLDPAGIQMFQTKMPPGARVNPDDPIAPHIVGGPAGGYWCTANDLLQFGDWLGEQSKRASFMRLVELYGGEFYKDRVFEHDGEIPNSGTYFSYRIDNSLTMVAMVEMRGFGYVKSLAQDVLDHLLPVIE